MAHDPRYLELVSLDPPSPPNVDAALPDAEPTSSPARRGQALEQPYRAPARQEASSVDSADPLMSLPAGSSYDSGPQGHPDDFADSGDRYERRLVLGEGGMGRVTLVHDRRLGRDVALKEAVPGRGRGHELRLEASLTARLEHPAIVPIYEAHRTSDGSFAYTMRLLRGRSLEVVLAEPGLDSARRRTLERHLLVASQAVAWAHTHGIVHRDLKPANIMLGEFGETQVVDWGLARSLYYNDTSAGLAGTPHYMSPEQARGRPADARSDVYALGLILYELETGRRARATLTTEEALAAAKRGDGPVRLDSISTDLFALIQRATAFDPELRYPDAKAFSQDLAAWVDGRRIAAHEYTPFELLRRLVAAWRVPILVGLVLVLVGAIAVGLSLSEAATQRDYARSERSLAEDARQVATLARAQAEAELARSLVVSSRAMLEDGHRFEALDMAIDAVELLERGVHDPETMRNARGVVLSAGSVSFARPDDIAPLPPHEQWIAGPDLMSGLAILGDRLTYWDTVHERADWTTVLSEVLGDDRAIEWVAALGHGEVVVGAGGQIPFSFDLATGVARGTLELPFRGKITIVPGGLLIVGWDSLTLLGPEGRTQLVTTDCRDLVGAADQERLIALCRDGRIRTWGRGSESGALIDGGSLELKSPDTEPASIAIRTANQELVVGSTRGELIVASLENGEVKRRIGFGEGLVSRIELSADGRFVAATDERQGIALVDLETRTFLGRLPGEVSSGFRFAEFGSTLATWGDRELVRWSLDHPGPRQIDVGRGVTSVTVDRGLIGYAASERQGLHTLEGLTIEALDTPHVVKAALLTKASGCPATGAYTFATAGVGNRLRLTGSPPMETITYQRGQVSEPMPRRLVAVRPNNSEPCERLALSLMDHGGLILWGRDGVPIWERGDSVRGVDLAASYDGELAVASMGAGMEVHVFRFDPGPSLVPIPTVGGCTAVAAAPSFEGLVACARDRDILIVDLGGSIMGWLPLNPSVATGRAETSFPTELAWSPDGRFLAAGTRQGEVVIWSAPGSNSSATVLAVISEHRERVAALTFDSASRWLFSGSWDRMVRPHDLDLLGLDMTELRSRFQAISALGATR